MGSLSRVPCVYVDAQILIYSGELDPRYWPTLKGFWKRADAGELQIVTSELSVLECLVHPLRFNDAVDLRAFESLFARTDLQLLPVSLVVLREAARLRAGIHGLKTPDAIHAATALATKTSLFFFTNDVGFRRVPGLDVRYLGDGLPQFS